MKKSRFSDAQILAILRQGEGGVPVADLCREHGISNATYYNWRSKYGGMITLKSTSLLMSGFRNCLPYGIGDDLGLTAIG